MNSQTTRPDATIAADAMIAEYGHEEAYGIAVAKVDQARSQPKHAHTLSYWEAVSLKIAKRRDKETTDEYLNRDVKSAKAAIGKAKPVSMTVAEEVKCRMIAAKGGDANFLTKNDATCPLDRMALTHAARSFVAELDGLRALIRQLDGCFSQNDYEVTTMNILRAAGGGR